MIPKLAILFFEDDDVSGAVEARIAAGIVKQHESDESGCLRSREGSRKGENQAAKANGFGAEVSPDQLAAASCHVTFVEDEIDCGQHGIETSGHFVCDGNGIGNSGLADFALGANEALSHCRNRDEEGARDLVRLKAAKGAECEFDLRLQWRARDGNR